VGGDQHNLFDADTRHLGGVSIRRRIGFEDTDLVDRDDLLQIVG